MFIQQYQQKHTQTTILQMLSGCSFNQPYNSTDQHIETKLTKFTGSTTVPIYPKTSIKGIKGYLYLLVKRRYSHIHVPFSMQSLQEQFVRMMILVNRPPNYTQYYRVCGACSYGLSYHQATHNATEYRSCLLYTSPSPRDKPRSRMPSSA